MTARSAEGKGRQRRVGEKGGARRPRARQPPAGNQPVTRAPEAGRDEGRGRGRGQGRDHEQRQRPRPEAEAGDREEAEADEAKGDEAKADEAEANEEGNQHARARRKPGRGEQGPRARTRARAPPEQAARVVNPAAGRMNERRGRTS